jgi:hypothetical protein
MAELKFAIRPRGRKPENVRRNTIAERSHQDPSKQTVPELQRRDKFVEGLLLGMPRIDAAIYAGHTKAQAVKQGTLMFYEPYVQARFHALREAMEEENLITRKELILNLKSIAIDDMEDSRNRISSSALIAKIMGYEAPTKTANLHLIQGGVMLVPVAGTPAQWEEAAMETQTRLKENVRQ